MPRLPPAEKLPLAARKNLRDGWENKREEWEQKISAILGEPWTIKVDPLAIYPYAESGSWGQTSPGDLINGYIEGVEYQLKYFIDSNGEAVKNEINEICSAHVITIDYDEDKTVSYCGCKVSPEGELVILFAEGNLGTNVNYAIESGNLKKALNNGPPSGKPMSFLARQSIAQDYDPKIKEIQEKVNKLLGKEVPLVPNFEDNFAKLKGDSKVRDDFETNIGGFTLYYFEALASYLDYNKFGEDELLQEGLLEALEGNAIHFRVVDALKRSYNESVVEGGLLYLQTTPENFGTNVNDVASNLIDIL